MKDQEYIVVGGILVVGLIGLYFVTKQADPNAGPTGASPNSPTSQVAASLGAGLTQSVLSFGHGIAAQIGVAASNQYDETFGNGADTTVTLVNGPGTPLYDAAKANAIANGWPVYY